MTTTLQRDKSPPLDLCPKLGNRFALRPKHLLIVLWFGCFFLHFSYIPIFHSDIWGHVAYGEWILKEGTLPAEDPFVHLVEGVPIVDTAWLGQVVFSWAEKAGGAEGIVHVFALSVLTAYLVLARTFHLQTGRSGLATVGAALVWIVGFSRHAIVRPEIFGSLCFAVLLWLVVGADRTRSRVGSGGTAPPATEQRHRHGRTWTLWIGVPVLFAGWANLHGSFVVGFAVLGCYLLGRAVEVLWTTRSPAAVLGDPQFRRFLIAVELAVGASLLNPYGIDLLIHTALFPSNPNLNDVLEWFRLEMVSYEGIEIGFSWILMLVLLRHSRARVNPTDVLLLMVFTLAVCLRVRMVTWYAPVVVLVLMPHLSDVAEQIRSKWLEQKAWFSGRKSFLTARSYRYTLFCGLLAWVCFAFSPISRPVLGGKPRKPEHLYSSGTPRALTHYLREHPPRSQIANPQWWGDWLVWDGPPDLQVFMTTNAVHVAPQRVWKDYLAIARGEPGLLGRLDRYRINTIVVHKELQARLTRRVRRLDGWETVYEDDIGLIAVREAAGGKLGR